MSASFQKRSPLPAAFIAIAVTAGASVAHAGEPVVPIEAGALTEIQQDLLAGTSSRVQAVYEWIARIQTGAALAIEAGTDIAAIASQQVTALGDGLQVVSAWSAEQTEQIADQAVRLSSQIAALAAEPGLGQLVAQIGRATTTIQGQLEAALLTSNTSLTSFGLRIAGAMPGEAAGAQASLQAQIQPLYDTVAMGLAIGRRVTMAVDWSAIDANLTDAKATPELSDTVRAGIDSVQSGFAQLKAMADRNLDIAGLAKEEILKAVSATARLALASLPKRDEIRHDEQAMLIDAADMREAPRAFGRRIDYFGMARRWVGEP